jgi:hypothetical protein
MNQLRLSIRREAERGPGRALLAQALFERIDVLGFAETTVTLTEHASRHGFWAVLPEEIGISVSGRGERSQTDPGDLNVPFRLMRELIGRSRWSQSSTG